MSDGREENNPYAELAREKKAYKVRRLILSCGDQETIEGYRNLGLESVAWAGAEGGAGVTKSSTVARALFQEVLKMDDERYLAHRKIVAIKAHAIGLVPRQDEGTGQKGYGDWSPEDYRETGLGWMFPLRDDL